MLIIIVRLGPLFDISEARPGEQPHPLIWHSIWLSRLLCCLWGSGTTALLLCWSVSHGQTDVNWTKRSPVTIPDKNKSNDRREDGTRRRSKLKTACSELGVGQNTSNANFRPNVSNRSLLVMVLVSWLILGVALFFALGREVCMCITIQPRRGCHCFNPF